MGIFLMLIFVAFVIAGAWLSIQDMEQRIRRKTGNTLVVVAGNTMQHIQNWLDSEIDNLGSWANLPVFKSRVQSLLSVPREKDIRITSYNVCYTKLLRMLTNLSPSIWIGCLNVWII